MSYLQMDLQRTQYLTFSLAGEQYAIPLLRVKEIIPFGRLTHIPRTPDFIRGVINLRGSVVPVADLAMKFALPATPTHDRTCIIIIELNPDGEVIVMGVIAESVSQVIDLATTDIVAAPPFGTSISMDFLSGLGRISDQFVLLLDIEKVFLDTAGKNTAHSSTSPGTVFAATSAMKPTM